MSDRTKELAPSGATATEHEVAAVVVVDPPLVTDLVLAAPLPEARHPAWAYLASLNEKTSRPTMAHALNLIARLCGYPNLDACPWQALRFEHVNAIRAKLVNGFVLPGEMNANGRRRGRPPRSDDAAAPDAAAAGEVVRLSPASGRKHMAALRGVLRYAWELGYFSYDDYARSVNVKPITGDSVAAADAGRSLTQGELLALIQVSAADPHPDGARDVAIFSLGYGLGLRRSDLITLDLEDYDPASATLTFRGKGNKQTALPVEGGAGFALEQWIAFRGDEPGPMFYRVRAFGHVVRKRMTTQAIYDIVRRRAREANVQPFSPHDLRRTFAGDMLDLGVDLATLQQLMRHADPRTTAGYDRRPGRVRREAVRRLHIPSVPLARKGA